MTDEHDDDKTKPDLPSGLGTSEEPTNPGIGPVEPFVAAAPFADRGVAALAAMGRACPPDGAPGRDGHLERISWAWAEHAMLAWETSRLTTEKRRQERAEREAKQRKGNGK